VAVTSSYDHRTGKELNFGTSTDAKPTDQLVGATFIETDTGDGYVWDGTTWQIDLLSLSVYNWTDRVTSAVRTIGTEHSYIHEGIMFSTYTKLSLTAGNSANIQLTTPAVKYIHWRPSNLSSSGDNVTATLYEGSSTASTSSGTLQPANRDRVVTTTSTVTVLSTATVTSLGTAIDAAYIGGGTGVGGTRSGAETGENNEIVLAQSETYTLRIENGSTAANTVFVKLQWYEETGA
jgi:hypothetical protein